MFVTCKKDLVVLPEESQALYDRAGEPKRLVVFEEYGHYDVYSGPAFRDVMDETIKWFGETLT